MSQREIKFRAWDSENKKMMHAVDSISWNLNHDKCFAEIVLGKSKRHQISNPVLMQFTGLYDENKKGIYEGDIVRGESHDGRRMLQAPVIWTHAGWFVGCLTGNITALDAVGNPQVVGNIYENPEFAK